MNLKFNEIHIESVKYFMKNPKLKLNFDYVLFLTFKENAIVSSLH